MDKLDMFCFTSRFIFAGHLIAAAVPYDAGTERLGGSQSGGHSPHRRTVFRSRPFHSLYGIIWTKGVSLIFWMAPSSSAGAIKIRRWAMAARQRKGGKIQKKKTSVNFGAYRT